MAQLSRNNYGGLIIKLLTFTYEKAINEKKIWKTKKGKKVMLVDWDPMQWQMYKDAYGPKQKKVGFDKEEQFYQR